MKRTGSNVVRIESEALRALADRVDGPMAAAFQRAVDLMFSCAGRVVVTGMGKSGLIARKIAATLSSTGSPALYLHPVEALPRTPTGKVQKFLLVERFGRHHR